MMKRVFWVGVLFTLLLLTGSDAFTQSFSEEITAIADIIVDIKGSGDYTTVQEAINSIPDDNDTAKIIFVRNGIYYEKVILGYKKTNVILVGEDVDSTIISYDDNAQIYKDTLGNGHTFSTYTFRADANDFHAYNISFRNNAEESGKTGDAQAVAYHSNGDRQILYHCRIIGRQDTYFDSFRTRKYFKDCFIEGTTDYIFGFGVTLFDSCQIHSIAGNYITAASTPENYEFGQVFRYCRLTGGPGVNGISLGRPWFDWANTIFYECWEPESILPQGWSTWSGREATCIYREYNCFGPGSDTLNRIEFGKQLDPSLAPRYNIDTIFAASNFPSTLGYTADTNEFMHVRRRFEGSGYAERADTIIYAGRDTFPTYPSENWSPEFQTEILNLVNKYTNRFMDSVNAGYTIESIKWNNNDIPEFEESVLDYVVELDDTVTIMPTLTVTGDNIHVSITYPESIPGKAVVTILSKDKVNGSDYTVYFSQDSAYWDGELVHIIINREDTIDVVPGIFDYDFELASGETDVRTVTITRKVSDQKYRVEYPDEFPGTINIIVTAPDGVTIKTYHLNVTLNLSVSELQTNSDDIHLVNPASDLILVYNNSDQIKNAAIRIFDLSGKILIAERQLNLNQGINYTGINISELRNGIYVYNILANNKNYNGKFIKSN